MWLHLALDFLKNFFIFSYLCLNIEKSQNINTQSYQTRMWLKFKAAFASIDVPGTLSVIIIIIIISLTSADPFCNRYSIYSRFQNCNFFSSVAINHYLI